METRISMSSLDRDRINVSEYYELEYWSNKFGVSIERLKTAVKAVGNSITAVSQYLNK
jgi:translation initiation factor 6 (eIF-6)